MTCDQNQIVDHSPNSSALDRAVTNGHISPFHCCCSDDAKNVVSDHRELQNQRICLKFSVGQTLDAHIGLDLTVILLADSMIMIQRDDFFVGNSERFPVHINFSFRKKHLLTVCIGCSSGDFIDHTNGEFSVLLSLKIPPCTADIDNFSVSGMLHIFADRCT